MLKMTVGMGQSCRTCRHLYPRLPASGSAGSQPDPGPDSDDTSLADFCARRGDTTSGVEQAATTDRSAFRLGCGDLVGAPSRGGDCTIIGWAAPEDFDGALHPPARTTVAGMNERGTAGDCELSNALEIMRGRTALLLSANLKGVVLCPPIVCNPALLRNAGSPSTDLDPAEFATVTPAPGNDGEISELTLCNFGPGSEYKTVSSLKAGQIVKIVGVGEIKGLADHRKPGLFRGCLLVEEDKVIPKPDFDPAYIRHMQFPVTLPREPARRIRERERTPPTRITTARSQGNASCSSKVVLRGLRQETIRERGDRLGPSALSV